MFPTGLSTAIWPNLDACVSWKPGLHVSHRTEDSSSTEVIPALIDICGVELVSRHPSGTPRYLGSRYNRAPVPAALM